MGAKEAYLKVDGKLRSETDPLFIAFKEGYEGRPKSKVAKSGERVSREIRDYEFTYRRGQAAKIKGYWI